MNATRCTCGHWTYWHDSQGCQHNRQAADPCSCIEAWLEPRQRCIETYEHERCQLPAEPVQHTHRTNTISWEYTDGGSHEQVVEVRGCGSDGGAVVRGLTRVAVEAGLVTQNDLAEFARWGHPDLSRGEDVDQERKLSSVTEIVAALEGELMSRGQVLVQETDLDIVQTYLQTQRQAMMYLETDTQTTEFPVTIGVTKLEEVIMPFKGEGISELMMNGRSHLKFSTADGNNVVHFFTDVREVCLGDQKSFLICTVQADPGAPVKQLEAGSSESP